ncbi:MAG: hypothetical protein QM733_11445 [Ilumatobacteraceae bacterium]
MAYSDWDDYLVHQGFTTIDHVEDNDVHYTDRFYFNCHARDGSVLVTTGYGVFPNTQTAAGYCKLAFADGRHWDFGSSRRLTEARWDPHTGPMRWTVLEPRKRWRLQLEPNDSGVEWDIEYVARAPIWELQPIFGRKRGKVIVHQNHIQQSATYSGWVKADGETISVDGFYGSRDRTWGIRNHAEIDMWIWYAAQFEDRAIAAWVWERADGSVMYVDGGFCHTDGTISKRFTKMEHDVTFDDGFKRPRAAVVVFTDEDGTRYEVKASAAHPNVNTYYGRNIEPGDSAFEWQRWDETEPDTLRQVEALAPASDQVMQYELDGMTGYGIFELLGRRRRVPALPTELAATRGRDLHGRRRIVAPRPPASSTAWGKEHHGERAALGQHGRATHRAADDRRTRRANVPAGSDGVAQH